MMVLILYLLTVWTGETVVTGPDLSLGNIGVDSHGNPYILALARNHSVPGNVYYLILYSRELGGDWKADTFETYGAEPLFINGDIAIDCHDRIWVIYSSVQQTGDDDYVVVACKDSIGWTRDTVDTGSCHSHSIATDSEGNPHIVFDSYDPPYIWRFAFYGYYDGSSWMKEFIDTVSNNHCSVDLDSDGTPHISYYHFGMPGRQDIWYTTKPDVWLYDEVDNTNSSWFWTTSISVGPDGLPGIAYTDPRIDEALKYAYFDGRDWNIDTLEAYGGICNSQKALDKDSLGQPYVVYAWAYKTWIAYKTTEWHKEVLPESPIEDSYGSMRIDRSGLIHVARLSYNDDYREIHYIYGNVGIEENRREGVESDFRVYPNPFGSRIKMTARKGKVDVYDISGRLVDSFRLQGTIEWNTSRLSSGIYFLRCETENSVTIKKVVKR